MRALLSIVLCLFAVSAFAEPGSRFLVDYTYTCQRFIKNTGTLEYVLDENTEYLLKVGNKREKLLFAFDVGGPWFVLQEKNTGHAMVYGVTNCFYKESVSVNYDCIDKESWDANGFGYYWNGGSESSSSNPRELPGLTNYNFSLSRGFWRGEPTGKMSTSVLIGYDYVSEKDSVYNIRWECYAN